MKTNNPLPPKHTPGPWKACLGDTYVTVMRSENGQPVCDLQADQWSAKDEGTVADALLIAAAPEMLEALKAWAKGCGDCVPKHPDPFCEICGPTRALIAKAEGK